MIVIIVCLIVGLVAGLIGSMVGLGGGVILVPALLILYEISSLFDWATSSTVAALSLVVIIFTAASSTYAYTKQKRVDYKIGVYFLAGSLPAGIIGAWLNQFVDTEIFSVSLGFVMLGIFVIFLLRKKYQSKETPQRQPKKNHIIRQYTLHQIDYEYSFSPVGAAVVSFVVGLLSGFFGIGGGSLMVPAMILLYHIPTQIAAATSMFLILVTSFASSLMHISLGHIEWQYVWPFIPGAWLGGMLGAKISSRLSNNTVETMLKIVLLIIGIRLIWQGLL